MKTSPLRIVAGLAILLFGIGALIDALGYGSTIAVVHTYWPLLIIVFGLALLIESGRNYLWGLLALALGVALQLRELGIVHFEVFQLFWPALLIVVGVRVLFNRGGPRLSSAAHGQHEVSALFGGANHKDASPEYTGGKVSAVFGGAKLDLRQATIKDEATLVVTAIAGGIEILVPAGWQVRSKLMPILGGFDDKTSPATAKHAPVLTIVGDVIMGGVEVKHEEDRHATR